MNLSPCMCGCDVLGLCSAWVPGVCAYVSVNLE